MFKFELSLSETISMLKEENLQAVEEGLGVENLHVVEEGLGEGPFGFGGSIDLEFLLLIERSFLPDNELSFSSLLLNSDLKHLSNWETLHLMAKHDHNNGEDLLSYTNDLSGDNFSLLKLQEMTSVKIGEIISDLEAAFEFVESVVVVYHSVDTFFYVFSRLLPTLKKGDHYIKKIIAPDFISIVTMAPRKIMTKQQTRAQK